MARQREWYCPATVLAMLALSMTMRVLLLAKASMSWSRLVIMCWYRPKGRQCRGWWVRWR